MDPTELAAEAIEQFAEGEYTALMLIGIGEDGEISVKFGGSVGEKALMLVAAQAALFADMGVEKK